MQDPGGQAGSCWKVPEDGGVDGEAGGRLHGQLDRGRLRITARYGNHGISVLLLLQFFRKEAILSFCSRVSNFSNPTKHLEPLSSLQPLQVVCCSTVQSNEMFRWAIDLQATFVSSVPERAYVVHQGVVEFQGQTVFDGVWTDGLEDWLVDYEAEQKRH